MRSKQGHRQKLLGALLGMGLGVAGISPVALAADALDKLVTVDIPAQPLAGALTQLAAQSGTQILAPAGMPGERGSAGVHGQMPLRDALTSLLQGSALGFHLAGDNSVGIDLAAGTPPSTQPPVALQVASAPDSNRQSTTLGEIVVTATKRAESKRKLPQTVDVLKGKDLEDIGAREMEDYLKYVPGITLQEGDTATARVITIRGIGPQPGANTTVGVLVDDVPMGDPYASYLVPDIDPFDLHDLEVLKGPQGTLFGASALVGAIRYVLEKPHLSSWEAKGFVDWLHIQGAGSGPTFGGAVNIPIGDTIALRAVDVVQEVPGLYNDVNSNGKNIRDADNGYKRMYRVLGTWQPSERFSATAFYLVQKNHRNDLSVANNANGSFTRTDTPGSSTSSQGISVGNLDLRYNFDWATLVSETSHGTKLQNLDYDASAVVEPLAVAGVQSLRIASLVDSKSINQEVRLMSPAKSTSPWVWTGGFYYSHYDANLTDNIYVPNTGLLAQTLNGLNYVNAPVNVISLLTPTAQGISVEDIHYFPLSAQEESLFGEVTRRLFSDKLSLTAGGRVYREYLSANVTLNGLTAPYGNFENYSGYKSMKSDGFNPKGTAAWQITDNLLWYANASHGFQFGGLNDPAPIPSDNTYPLSYKPSTLWSYETGLRTDWLHKRLQFDITPFVINWKDMQIAQTTPDGITTYTANVGRARSKGIETSLNWLTPIKGLTFTNVASYIHAKVAESYTTSQGVFIPAGTDLPAAPRLQTATTLAYNRRFDEVAAGIGVTWSHQGRAFNNITHDAIIYRYNTMSLNANLGLPHVFMAPAITVNATNLLNAHALNGAQIDRAGNTQLGVLDNFVRPRAVDLRISGQF